MSNDNVKLIQPEKKQLYLVAKTHTCATFATASNTPFRYRSRPKQNRTHEPNLCKRSVGVLPLLRKMLKPVAKEVHMSGASALTRLLNRGEVVPQMAGTNAWRALERVQPTCLRARVLSEALLKVCSKIVRKKKSQCLHFAAFWASRRPRSKQQNISKRFKKNSKNKTNLFECIKKIWKIILILIIIRK